MNGKVEQRLCPAYGQLMDILRLPSSPIVNDDKSLEQCRLENPDDGPGS